MWGLLRYTKIVLFNSVAVDHGVVTWLDGDIDCAPEYMYTHSYAYEEILV